MLQLQQQQLVVRQRGTADNVGAGASSRALPGPAAAGGSTAAAVGDLSGRRQFLQVRARWLNVRKKVQVWWQCFSVSLL